MSKDGPPRSLFGGPLSTRQQCIDREALRREQARLDAEAAGKARKAAKHQQHHAPPKPGARDPQRPSLLQKETPESKKKRLYQEALNDFDDLLTDGPAKPRPKPPPPRPQQHQHQHQHQQWRRPEALQQQPGQLPRQPPLKQQQQQQQMRTSSKSSKVLPPAKPGPSRQDKQHTTMLGKRPTRKEEADFDKEDRAELEEARRAWGQGAGHLGKRPEVKRRNGVPDQDSEDDLDGFVVDDEEDEEPEWQREIRALTGYDPRRFQNEKYDDRSMEASYKDILAEERRSARLEDKKEEEEERRRLEAKAKAKKKSKTR